MIMKTIVKENTTREKKLRPTDKQKVPEKRVKTPWASLYGLYKDRIFIADGDVFNLEL